MSIRYFNDGIKFQVQNKRKISEWLKKIITQEGKKTGDLSFIFVSNEIILDINKKFLNHDYYTDIITFDYSTQDSISGEMYISIETVKENAILYGAEFTNELLRVMLHGILHLCGYKDATIAEQQTMRATENNYLNNIPQLET